MAHVRTQIREAVKNLLTGLTTSGSRVYISRSLVFQDSELPGLQIKTNGENLETIDIHGEVLERTMVLTVTARAKMTDNLDVELDTMIAEVEAKLNESVASNTLAGLCQKITPTGLDIDIDEDGEEPIGFAEMRFDLIYHTNASAPGVSI